MSDISVTLPFSSGVVAAIIFFTFEIIVFPLTLFATSVVAALTLQARAERGRFIHVRSILFPLWSEGLLNNQKSHWLLLIIRIVIIGIPVYLETRLISSDRPLFQSIVLPHAFEVNPKTNWVIYGNTSGDAIFVLRENGEHVFTRCTFYNDDGWLVAKVANVSYLENRDINKLNCINGTEKEIYKLSEEIPDYIIPTNVTGSPSEHKDMFNALVSISYGTVDSFPKSPETHRVENYDTIYRVDNITLLNDSDIQCYSSNVLERFSNISSIPLDIMCQNTTDNVVDFLWGGTQPFDFSNGKPNITFKNGTIEHGTATLVINLYFVTRIQFRDDIIFTAEHIVNIDFKQLSLFTSGDFVSKVRSLLYTKKDNRTTIMRLKSTKTETKLDFVFIIIATVQFMCVLIFGICMIFVARNNLRLQEIPTTLNGLSKCWAQSSLSRCSETGSQKHVTLKIGALAYKHGIKPSLIQCSENMEVGIFDHIGSGTDTFS